MVRAVAQSRITHLPESQRPRFLASSEPYGTTSVDLQSARCWSGEVPRIDPAGVPGRGVFRASLRLA
jgi:hypothetical protein